MKGSKALDESSKLYDLMKDASEPLYLKLNNITYEMDNTGYDSASSKSVKSSNPWFKYCQD